MNGEEILQKLISNFNLIGINKFIIEPISA